MCFYSFTSASFIVLKKQHTLVLLETLLEPDRKVTQVKCGGSSRPAWKTSWTNFPVWVPGVSVAGNSGLGSTCACGVTLVGHITFSDPSFLTHKTKGVPPFSDP